MRRLTNLALTCIKRISDYYIPKKNIFIFFRPPPLTLWGFLKNFFLLKFFAQKKNFLKNFLKKFFWAGEHCSPPPPTVRVQKTFLKKKGKRSLTRGGKKKFFLLKNPRRGDTILFIREYMIRTYESFTFN